MRTFLTMIKVFAQFWVTRNLRVRTIIKTLIGTCNAFQNDLVHFEVNDKKNIRVFVV